LAEAALLVAKVISPSIKIIPLEGTGYIFIFSSVISLNHVVNETLRLSLIY
jgi:hypothetical protein